MLAAAVVVWGHHAPPHKPHARAAMSRDVSEAEVPRAKGTARDSSQRRPGH